MNLVRLFDGFGRCFGQAQVTYLAFLKQFRHLPDSFLDGHLGVDTVLIVKVYRVHAETAQAGFASGANVFGPAVDSADIRVLYTSHNAEFGGEKDFIASLFYRFADK